MTEILSPEQVDAVADKIGVPGSRCTVQTTRNIIATLRQAWLERDRLAKLLHDLTPGGSEFANNPDRCAKWIAAQQSEHIRMIVEATAEVVVLMEALEELVRQSLGADEAELLILGIGTDISPDLQTRIDAIRVSRKAAYAALFNTPLAAEQVERVRRLEAVAKAAADLRQRAHLAALHPGGTVDNYYGEVLCIVLDALGQKEAGE